EAGKQRGQRNAGDNAEPNPETWDVRHRTFSRQVSQRPRHAYRVTASKAAPRVHPGVALPAMAKKAAASRDDDHPSRRGGSLVWGEGTCLGEGTCGRWFKRARPASSRRWQEFCRRRQIDNALSARAIIVPKLLVAEINEGADHEGEG